MTFGRERAGVASGNLARLVAYFGPDPGRQKVGGWRGEDLSSFRIPQGSNRISLLLARPSSELSHSSLLRARASSELSHIPLLLARPSPELNHSSLLLARPSSELSHTLLLLARPSKSYFTVSSKTSSELSAVRRMHTSLGGCGAGTGFRVYRGTSLIRNRHPPWTSRQ